jgi:hypothetical protein
MGDGAEWIWNLAALHFPGATEIVDLSRFVVARDFEGGS